MTIEMIMAIIIAVFTVVGIWVIIITIRISAVIASLCEAIAAIGSAGRIVCVGIRCTGAQKQDQHTGDK
jgi:hypothetical protein